MSETNPLRLLLVGPDEGWTVLIATEISKRLDLSPRFISQEIEIAEKKTIDRIEMLLGEHEVHNLEAKCLDKLVAQKTNRGEVVAFSPRIVLDATNRQVITDSQLPCLWLDLSEEAFIELGHSMTDWVRYTSRQVLFAEVALSVYKAENALTPKEVVDEICKEFSYGGLYAREPGAYSRYRQQD